VIGAVFRYAIATGRATTDPTYALRGALTAPVVRHRAAITDPSAFGGLLRAIDGFGGQPVSQVGGSADIDQLVINEPSIDAAGARRIDPEGAEERICGELISPRICEAILGTLPKRNRCDRAFAGRQK